MGVSRRVALAALLALSLSAPAFAQSPSIGPFQGKAKRGPPPGLTPYEAAVWPFPPPDPKGWWDDKRPKPDEAADPLGGRRLKRGERLPAPDNGVSPAIYRLWGLMPLQWQALRGDETIFELWTRPSDSVRQSVVRITLRGDGDAFVQARAGLACCDAGIGRRMGFDAKLPADAGPRFKALRDLPLWSSPRDVRVVEPDSADALCVQGSAYDLTLATRTRVTTLRRACDPAEVGEVAEVLAAVVRAALGHDPRFDLLFPGDTSFAGPREAYRDLLARGGRLKANPDARRTVAGDEPAPQLEPEPPAPTPAPPAAPRPSAPSGPGSEPPSRPPPGPSGSPGGGR